MAQKAIAVVGDASAAASTTTTFTSRPGAWAPGTVSVESYSNLSVGGTEVIHSAECTFTFTYSDGQSPTSATSKVTLSAAGTTLAVGGQAVLVDGDQAQDSSGNRIVVSAAGAGQSNK